jgi:hypothetical protein
MRLPEQSVDIEGFSIAKAAEIFGLMSRVSRLSLDLVYSSPLLNPRWPTFRFCKGLAYEV